MAGNAPSSASASSLRGATKKKKKNWITADLQKKKVHVIMPVVGDTDWPPAGDGSPAPSAHKSGAADCDTADEA